MTSRSDYGYPPKEGRRKVLLWSRAPWRDVDDLGDPALPGGRFVAGTTDTPVGEVRVLGVCIPWRDAHVRTGRRDRAGWEDHLTYLTHLGPLLRREAAEHTHLVVAGDYNQRIPRRGQPERVADALEQAFRGLEVVTAGVRCEGRSLIDHVAVNGGLVARAVETLPRADGLGRLSDHDAVVVELRAA
jgi:endonuclease/exonuclease/phosphatase family metal-dependent hydrolase